MTVNDPPATGQRRSGESQTNIAMALNDRYNDFEELAYAGSGWQQEFRYGDINRKLEQSGPVIITKVTQAFGMTDDRRSTRRMAVLLLMTAICLVTVGYMACVWLQIRERDLAFKEIHAGDPETQVLDKMGTPDSIRHGDKCFSVGRANVGREVFQYVYTTKTFFLPVSWVIEFNDENLVEEKFRLD